MTFNSALGPLARAGARLTKGRGISHRQACVCIIGVGYVGESLLGIFGKVMSVIGFDISQSRVQELRLRYRNVNTIHLTSNPADLERGTHFLIAVPTPLHNDNTVDLHHILNALEVVLSCARPGSCIVIESSVPVGTTRKLLGPIKTTFRCGMSPERIDPGRKSPLAEEIPKIVGGLTTNALESLLALYKTAFHTVVPVSKPEVAEMTKLYENCYRMVNIAYVNEISDACLLHGIDPHEMIGAAATKPFGFQPFVPGLGVGGHCLPVNPWYLLQNNKQLRVLEVATKLMSARPRVKARKFYQSCLSFQNIENRRPNVTPRVLIVGLGFKSGQSNTSYSPALAFAEALYDLGCAQIKFYDPCVCADSSLRFEKLDESQWTRLYLDSSFDGVALCNRTSAKQLGVLDELQSTFVQKYV